MDKKFFLAIGTLACAISHQVCADNETFYVGGLLGEARGEVGSAEMNQRMASLGYDAHAKVSGQNRTAWEIFGGYRFSDYISLEAGYLDLGEVRTRLTGSPVDIQDYLNSANLVHPRSASGYELAGLARYPFDEKNSVYLRGGILFANSRYKADAQTDFAKRSENERKSFIGIGYGYEINDRWGLQLSYEKYRVEGENIGLLGLGVRYKFETTKHNTVAGVDSEVKYQSEPVKEIQPIEKPPIDSPKSKSKPDLAPVVSIKLAVQFDTNSAQVKQNYLDDIVKLANYMNEHPSSKLTIQGHTDNQGNNQLNKNLSLERAKAVKNILVETYKIQSDRITALGFGAEKPIADNTTVEGRAANRRIMAEITN
jgi:OOP family OmpA-OmpF porin